MPICLLALALGHPSLPAIGAAGGGEAYRAWSNHLISEWEQRGTHERGADVTGFEIAGLRLFMTYDEVVERLEASGRPFEISATRRLPCANDRIEYATNRTETGANCIDYMEMALDPGDEGKDYLKAYFGEDVYYRPGSSMIVRIEYTKDYGGKSLALGKVYDEIKDRYRYQPEYPHLRYYIGHFAKLDSYPNVESEWQLPYLRMYLGSVSPISRYSLVLSAGEALRKDLEVEADRIVREATPVPEFKLPWGM